MCVKHIFGIDCSKRSSIEYLNENCLIYVTSRHLIFNEIDSNEQEIIPFENEFDRFQLLNISLNRKYLILGLKNLKKSKIILFDLNPLISNRPIERKRILLFKENLLSNEILSFNFSNDSKSLLILYGSPDHVLFYWSIHRWELISMINLSISTMNLQVSFNPNDCSEILITGNDLFEKYSFDLNRIIQRYESMNIIGHLWINSSVILLATQQGSIDLINHHGEIIQKIQILEEIVCLVRFSRGVVISTKNGWIHLYERNENPLKLKFLSQIRICSSNEEIHSMILNPNEDILLISTNANHLYEYSFPKLVKINRLNHHHGSIQSGSIAYRKSLLFTLGIDQSINIWNLSKNHQEFHQQFSDEILSINVHPNGLFLSISFPNVIHIYGLTIDGLILIEQLNISNARLIEFSHQGHFLCIAYENNLQIHSHWDYHQMIYGRTHGKKFRLIRWTNDDTAILTVNFDNSIIRWDPYTAEVLSQYEIIDMNIRDLVLSLDNQLAYLLGDNQKIQEFAFNTKNIRDLNVEFVDCIPRTLLFDGDLFVGTDQGSIYQISLNSSNIFIKKNLHFGSINRIFISMNHHLLISIGDDGFILTFQLNEQSMNSSREEILVKESILQQQNIQLKNLIESQMEINENFERIIEKKEEEYVHCLNQLKISSEIDQNRVLQQINQLKEQRPIFHEEDKSHSIHEYLQKKLDYFNSLISSENSLENHLEKFEQNSTEMSLSLFYQDQLNRIKKIFSKKSDHLKEIKENFDEQFQIELNHLDEFYQKQIQNLLHEHQQFENEQILFEIRIQQIENQSNEYENQIKQFHFQRNFLIDQMKKIDREYFFSKELIQQRNEILLHKFKRRNEMENRRDQLNKFLHVFHYKITELTNEISPRQFQINSLIEQFNKMENESNLLNENNQKSLIEISHFKSRLIAMDQDLKKQLFHIRQLNEILTNMKEDLKLCCSSFNRPKDFLEILRKIYLKYILSTNVDFGQMNLLDCDRERTYFEQTYRRLKMKIQFNRTREDQQRIRRIQEQINLMREISSYSFKIVQLEEIFTDLDLLANLSMKINAKTSKEIIDALQNEQNSLFIHQKQILFQSIRNKQLKRLENLTNLIDKFQIHLENQ